LEKVPFDPPRKAGVVVLPNEVKKFG